MAMSDYLEGKLIQHVYKGVNYTAPVSYEIGLFHANPTDAFITANELDSGTDLNYARVTVTFNTPITPDWIISNAADVVWASAGNNWREITHLAVFDEADNMLDHGPLISPKTVLQDGLFKILQDQLDIQYV